MVRDQCEKLSPEVTGIIPLFQPWEKVGAVTQSRHRSRTWVQLLPEEQGALRSPGSSQPPTPAPPHPSSPSPQSLLQTELQGSPPSPTPPLLTDIHCQSPVSRIRFSLFLLHPEFNWLILKHFFFHESYHVICTPSH